MSGVIEWSDPPPRSGTRPGKYAAARDALRERPGEWGLILATDNAAEVNRIRSAISQSAGFKVAGRKDRDNGITRVWARYTPDGIAS